MRYFLIFGRILGFLVRIMWFFSFSSKNDAESFRNVIKILVLDPNRAKLVRKSLRKVDGKLTLFPRPVQQDPYIGPYGPQLGQGPNPDRTSLSESSNLFFSFSTQNHAESFRNFVNNSVFDHLFLLSNSFIFKIIFYLQLTFFDGFNVFFRFLDEIRLITLIKSS